MLRQNTLQETGLCKLNNSQTMEMKFQFQKVEDIYTAKHPRMYE